RLFVAPGARELLHRRMDRVQRYQPDLPLAGLWLPIDHAGKRAGPARYADVSRAPEWVGRVLAISALEEERAVPLDASFAAPVPARMALRTTAPGNRPICLAAPVAAPEAAPIPPPVTAR